MVDAGEAAKPKAPKRYLDELVCELDLPVGKRARKEKKIFTPDLTSYYSRPRPSLVRIQPTDTPREGLQVLLSIQLRPQTAQSTASGMAA